VPALAAAAGPGLRLALVDAALADRAPARTAELCDAAGRCRFVSVYVF